MPQLEFDITYTKNSDLVMSADELKEVYFFGIPITDPSGFEMANETIEFYIRAAQQEIENYLSLKLVPQIIEEELDYRQSDWLKWNFVKTTYPVVEPLAMNGFIGDNVRHISVPKSWLTSRITSDKITYERAINMVPIGDGSIVSQEEIFAGIFPSFGARHGLYYGRGSIPNFWTIRYCTSFKKLPNDILDAVGKLASVSIFNIKGDLVLQPGLAGQSVSIDGLSQNITTTQSAENNAFSARVRMYQEELKKKFPWMKDYYCGINFTVA